MIKQSLKVALATSLLASLTLASQPAKIERVYATSPVLSSIIQVLAPQKLVGLTYKPYAEDKPYMAKGVADLPIYGGYMGNGSPNLERLLAAKPQMMFLSTSTPEAVIKRLHAFHIQTRQYDSFRYANLIKTIHAMALDMQVKSQWEKIKPFIDASAKLRDDAKITKPKRVYFAQGNDGLESECGYKWSDDKGRAAAMADDLAHMFYAENVILCNKGPMMRIQVNFEKLMLLNPDAIFVREVPLYRQLVSKKKSERGLFGKLAAVKKGAVYLAPSTPASWLTRPPSIMRIVGLPWAMSKLYPKRVSPAAVEKLAQDFFAAFLRPLSDEAYKGLQK